ncbi:hypothetical protein A5624_26770 [Mycobacterium sp. 1482292.6]|uniref:SRPBCC family protein n=1 Tax=unclassified Mycobacterium TaxID=2642494 RepID=UPI0008012A84|nr:MULTISPECIES: SRPBCC family protein [unclassified Mycobacterium]OBJ04532.1 hypothetical protein A5624_26770 [Mycobacterium sp. 1482292.6]OBJ21602.1 hypothetical protein A5622_17150 [Mycobacterium sp. 1245801.1]
MSLLQKDETLSAWTDVRAPAHAVYALVSDITRIPQWSPETVSARWLDAKTFEARNRRRLGRWTTTSNVETAEPDREFSFIVQAFGGDWTQWTFRLDSGPSENTTRLTESVRMCVPMPLTAVVFELLFLWVRDRRADLQANLEKSVERIRMIIEEQ